MSLSSETFNRYDSTEGLKTLFFAGPFPSGAECLDIPASTFYYLSEQDGWVSKSALDLQNCTTLTALSTITFVDSSLDSTPATNYWTTYIGSPSQDRYIQGDAIAVSAESSHGHWESTDDTATFSDVINPHAVYTVGRKNAVIKWVSDTPAPIGEQPSGSSSESPSPTAPKIEDAYATETVKTGDMGLLVVLGTLLVIAGSVVVIGRYRITK